MVEAEPVVPAPEPEPAAVTPDLPLPDPEPAAVAAEPVAPAPAPAPPEPVRPEPVPGPPLVVRTAGSVRAGAQLNVQVENLPAGTWRVALLWRPTPADAWSRTDAVLQRDVFAWTSPAADTREGRLRVEVTGTDGAVTAAAESGPLIVDGTPPEIQIETVPSPDPRRCAVRAVSRDAGAGIEWVSLFVSRDGGQSWTSGAMAMDVAVDMSMPREDRPIGFFAQAQDRVGNRSAAPRTGTPPQLAIGPRPALGIALSELAHQVVKGGERVLLTWSVAGEYADDCTAALEMQTEPGGPWERVDAVAVALKHAYWNVPAATVASLNLRILVSFPGGTTLASNAIGPYAVAAEPPTLVIGGGRFFASHVAAIPVAEMHSGPAELARVVMYVRPEGRPAWTPREARYAAGVVTMSTADLPEETYDLYAAAEDLCGNAAPAPHETAAPHAVLTVDRTPPRAKLKLNPPYYEGIAGTVDVTLSAPARVCLTVREDGDASEHILLERDLPAGSAALPFRPAPGFRSGTLSLRARDGAGNRAQTAAYLVNAGETLRLESPVDQSQLVPGAAVAVKWWIRQALLDERPAVDLWWLPGPGAVRESIARDLPPDRAFSWQVPDRPGAGQSLRVEARIGDVVRACADMSSTFAIVAPHAAIAPAAVKAPIVNPDSDEFALAGHVCLDELEKALAAKNMEKVKNFRLHAGNRFRQALSLDAGNANAWWGMARMCTAPISEIEELDKAEEYLVKAVAANPQHYDALVFLGACRIKLRKYQEAENSLALALNLRDSPIVRYNLGIALLRQEKHAPALAEFQRAAQGPGAIPAARLAIVECYVAQNEFLKARDAFREAQAEGAVPDEHGRRILKRIDDGLEMPR
ncbi:MAG TPA: hypothetical protein DCM87_18190 [Planctomycetes bacterium]|nr:hypothetical protein [Planctomycetota bacterium]